MYNKEQSISISCDNCGDVYIDEHTGFSLYPDEIGAQEAADNDGWHSSEGEHYCPLCHTINDNDELIKADYIEACSDNRKLRKMLAEVTGLSRIATVEEYASQFKAMEEHRTQPQQVREEGSAEDIKEAADNWVFEINGMRWSNNDNTAGDNFGSFIAGANWMKSHPVNTGDGWVKV